MDNQGLYFFTGIQGSTIMILRVTLNYFDIQHSLLSVQKNDLIGTDYYSKRISNKERQLANFEGW